jgi:hypothetical protein
VADKFVDFEDTEQLVLEAAHGEVVRMVRAGAALDSETHQPVGLSFADVAKLKMLHQIVRDSKLMALRQFEMEKRLGEPIVPSDLAPPELVQVAPAGDT